MPPNNPNSLDRVETLITMLHQRHSEAPPNHPHKNLMNIVLREIMLNAVAAEGFTNENVRRDMANRIMSMAEVYKELYFNPDAEAAPFGDSRRKIAHIRAHEHGPQ